MKLILKSLLVFLALLALTAIVRSCTRDKPATNATASVTTTTPGVTAQADSGVSGLSAALLPNNLEKEAALLEASAQREAALLAVSGGATSGNGNAGSGAAINMALADKNVARAFMAYFAAMGSTQAAVCEQVGAPVPRYIAAFAAVHRNELAFARAALGAEFASEIQAATAEHAEKKKSAEWIELAKDKPSEIVDNCKELNANADAMAVEMHVSKTLPELAPMLKNKK